MSIIANALNNYIDSIYKVTTDGYSDTTKTLLYSNVRCRWEEKVSEIINNEGSVLVYRVEVWILPTINLKEGYIFVKDSKNYTVVSIKKGVGIDGIHDHTKVYLE